ncbi:GNAT family N-acetyltransferase [Chryseobacterium bernardetii]|uniref:GNAT family N-acetyltransferase n=2 Tax=Chryseobacterium bernardetii TaxID=1241978 RepID=UPI003AF53C76
MIREITEKDYPQLMSIWESAVLNTHDFLKKEDFNYYKEQIPGYFEHVTLVGFEEANVLAGFMGVAEGNLEMLFIHNDYRGKGIGKKLIRYGMDRLEITKVDVNEQNIQAVGFYKHIGFHVLGRSESDGQGKEYPILHMGLESELK